MMDAAQNAISAGSGGLYADPECLLQPQKCLQNDAGAPFIAPDVELEGVHAGYQFDFLGYPPRLGSADDTPSYSQWTYTAVPINPEVTGTRSFCADNTGRICQWFEGTPRIINGQCACEPDRILR
jgi:hypothetical protein